MVDPSASSPPHLNSERKSVTAPIATTAAEVLPPGFERRTADVNGAGLSYLIGGSGPPVLLLLGWPQTSRAWLHLLEPLASQGYTVLAPDLRGLGQSQRAASGYDKDNQAEDMRQLLASLDLGPKVRIIGHDLGGMVAFSFARQTPTDVQRLCLIELAVPGFGLESAMDSAKGGRWHFGFFMAPEVAELLIEGREDLFFKWWFRTLSADGGASTASELDAVTTAYTGRESLSAGFSHYRTLLADGQVNREWGDAGGNLDIPVLAIGGEFAVGTRLGDTLRAAAPGVQTAVIGGSGHFVPEEKPAELLDQLVAFLA